MKKIFAISVLSVMAVVGTTNAWADTPLRNYNLATVNYVEDLVDEMIIPTGTTPTINKDSSVPSFARSEDLIQEAIVSTTETVSNKDAQAPTIANVEANFAPRIGDAVYQGRPYDNDSTVGEIDVTNLPSGEYSVIVSVDRSGNVSFRWVPIQIDSCTTTDGGTCGPV